MPGCPFITTSHIRDCVLSQTVLDGLGKGETDVGEVWIRGANPEDHEARACTCLDASGFLKENLSPTHVLMMIFSRHLPPLSQCA